MRSYIVLAAAVLLLAAPAITSAQPTATPNAMASATPAAPSPFAIPIGKEIGYRCQSSQVFGAEWFFTGAMVFKVDANGKITGGYLGDSESNNPSIRDPMLGRENPVTGTITPDNKIQLVIGTGSLQWTIQGTATPTEIHGHFTTGRFGQMTFYAAHVHIPKHPANIQNPG
jgi:hypothetical protein